MAGFISILEAGSSQEEKLQYHPPRPKFFEGTRLRPDNKVVCMLGIGVHAMYVLIDLTA